MVRRVDICIDCPFYICVPGLIVALIMNTAASGVTVRLRFSSKYSLSDFVSSAHNFPENTLRELGRPHCSWLLKFQIRIIFCLSSPRSVNVVSGRSCSDGCSVYEHSLASSCQYMFCVQCYFWKEWLW